MTCNHPYSTRVMLIYLYVYTCEEHHRMMKVQTNFPEVIWQTTSRHKLGSILINTLSTLAYSGTLYCISSTVKFLICMNKMWHLILHNLHRHTNNFVLHDYFRPIVLKQCLHEILLKVFPFSFLTNTFQRSLNLQC